MVAVCCGWSTHGLSWECGVAVLSFYTQITDRSGIQDVGVHKSKPVSLELASRNVWWPVHALVANLKGLNRASLFCLCSYIYIHIYTKRETKSQNYVAVNTTGHEHGRLFWFALIDICCVDLHFHLTLQILLNGWIYGAKSIAKTNRLPCQDLAVLSNCKSVKQQKSTALC